MADIPRIPGLEIVGDTSASCWCEDESQPVCEDAWTCELIRDHETLSRAAQAVVDQDRSTPAGESEFEEALHRLWLLIQRPER